MEQNSSNIFNMPLLMSHHIIYQNYPVIWKEHMIRGLTLINIITFFHKHKSGAFYLLGTVLQTLSSCLLKLGIQRNIEPYKLEAPTICDIGIRIYSVSKKKNLFKSHSSIPPNFHSYKAKGHFDIHEEIKKKKKHPLKQNTTLNH